MTSSAEPRVTLSAVRQFWEAHVNNEYYAPGHDRGSASYFEQIERRRYRWHYHLVELFASLRGSRGRLLEVGCGMGLDSVQLARCGFSVTALDLTEVAVGLARQFAEYRGVSVDFLVGNAEQLEFPDNSFDAVYSFGVLHHTPDIQRAVAEVHRVLRPGGAAYVMLYHRRSIVYAVHRLLRLPFESPRDLKDECPVVQTFTKDAAQRLFRDFASLSVHADYPFTYGFRFVTFWIPKVAKRMLGRLLGWHLMIHATK
ncbi:MAG: class I SAM-dependent methyltransferase [Gemmatimonadales bacterium]